MIIYDFTPAPEQLPHFTITLQSAPSTITVKDPNNAVCVVRTMNSANTQYECFGTIFGTYTISVTISSTTSSKAVLVDCAGEYKIEYKDVSVGGSNVKHWFVNGGIDNWTELKTLGVSPATSGKVIFSNLDPSLGYEINYFSPDGEGTVKTSVAYTAVTKTIASGKMALEYTITGGTDGEDKFALRILK